MLMKEILYDEEGMPKELSKKIFGHQDFNDTLTVNEQQMSHNQNIKNIFFTFFMVKSSVLETFKSNFDSDEAIKLQNKYFIILPFRISLCDENQIA